MTRKYRYTTDFARFLLSLRGAQSSVTLSEQRFLSELAANRSAVIEVGVHEGATSKVLRDAMNPDGALFLVDPYLKGVRLEKLLGVSFAEYVARRTLQSWKNSVTFVKDFSSPAADRLLGKVRADLIFIDAVHDYDAVTEDFLKWRRLLADDGVIAFHDSRLCDRRPDLPAGAGPVRLVEDIRQGRHGAWEICGEVDTVTAVKPAARCR
jgi:hypothetical protein